MTSPRDGVFSSDAVGILTGHGDRLDRLERFRTDPGESAITAFYWPTTEVPDDDLVLVGRITIPAGYSKLSVAAFFAGAGSSALTSFGIRFPEGWDADHVIVGGFTEGSGAGFAASRSSGLAILRASSRTTSPFYVGLTTEEGTGGISAGVLFVEPVASVGFL